MLRRLWINSALGILLLGCSTTTELETQITRPPIELLTQKSLIVQPADPASELAADLVRQLLQENGYVIRQDTNVTGALLEAFGTNQVQPTEDAALLRIKAQVSSPEHSSRNGTRQVSLSSCNNLRKKDPCSYRKTSISFVNHSVLLRGTISLFLKEAGRPQKTFTNSFIATTHGVIPKSPHDEMIIQMREAVYELLRDYLKQKKVVATGMKVDRLAADMIALGLYERAIVRLKDHETDPATQLYALGYIEERRGDFSGAVMYYQEGVLHGEQVELFETAISRVERIRAHR